MMAKVADVKCTFEYELTDETTRDLFAAAHIAGLCWGEKENKAHDELTQEAYDFADSVMSYRAARLRRRHDGREKG